MERKYPGSLVTPNSYTRTGDGRLPGKSRGPKSSAWLTSPLKVGEQVPVVHPLVYDPQGVHVDHLDSFNCQAALSMTSVNDHHVSFVVNAIDDAAEFVGVGSQLGRCLTRMQCQYWSWADAFRGARVEGYPVREETLGGRAEGVSRLLGIRKELAIRGVGRNVICDGENKRTSKPSTERQFSYIWFKPWGKRCLQTSVIRVVFWRPHETR